MLSVILLGHASLTGDGCPCSSEQDSPLPVHRTQSLAFEYDHDGYRDAHKSEFP